MDLYFAGGCASICNEYIIKNNLPRLLSQLNDRSCVAKYIQSEFKGKFFIDSGAYTAFTKGVNINVDDYINYVNERPQFTLVAQLDTIPGTYGVTRTAEDVKLAAEKSWENYLYMRERVNNVDRLIPIFHNGESYNCLSRMLEFKDKNGNFIPYIGLAPMTDLSNKQREIFIKKCFNIIAKSSNPNVKTHAFGMTSLGILERYPFTSADSTTWVKTGAYGTIMTKYGIILVSDKQLNNPKHYRNMPQSTVELFEHYVGENGFSVEHICSSSTGRILFNLKYLNDWQKTYQYKPNQTITTSLF